MSILGNATVVLSCGQVWEVQVCGPEEHTPGQLLSTASLLSLLRKFDSLVPRSSFYARFNTSKALPRFVSVPGAAPRRRDLSARRGDAESPAAPVSAGEAGAGRVRHEI